jgi:hypothetical protein
LYSSKQSKINYLKNVFSIVKSPFKRRASFNFQDVTAEEEEKFTQLRIFAFDCSLRFERMKIKRENLLEEKGKFVFN